jgi:transcriptional regulator with XRE-family HTH domain
MAKLSPTELAKLAGISVPYASQLLTGARAKPSLELALQIYDRTGYQFGILDGLAPDEVEILRKAAA